jgi:two-component system alkaline phosphatase synthesis response regulator PhoP
MPKERIVVIEDEPDILELIRHNLAREGFRVSFAADGDDGYQMVVDQLPDLVLLDLMLPGMDGLEVCRRLKEDPATRSVPVVMVTAKGEESDIVLGLGLGADDYVPKPFSPRELLARVRAVLRRTARHDETTAKERIVRDGVDIDAGRHRVRIDEETILFTATEFRLLHFLATRPGRIFTREQLVGHVIGESVVVTERNIDVHVRSIRKKLGKYRDLIETVRGVGYRFRETDS